MEFQIFNLKNTKSVATGTASVRMSLPSGIIGFSKAAAELMNLENETKVEFCLEEKMEKTEKVCNWYIHITNSNDAFVMRRKDATKQFVFNSSTFVRKISHDLNLVKTAAFKISKTPIEIEGEKYWPMITSNPIGAK